MKFHGLEHQSKSDIQKALENGGKFVVFQYVISIVILTFKRSSSVHFISPGGGAFGKSLKYSLLTSIYGWWGFPWGPIYSIGALFGNLSGGKDITNEIKPLIDGLDEAQIAALPKAGGVAGTVLAFVPALAFAALIFSWSLDGGKIDDPQCASCRAFKVQDSLIQSYEGRASFGNDYRALKIAESFSTTIKGIRDAGFSGEDEKHISASKGHFMTSVHLSKDSCGLIVHVPRFRNYDEKSKAILEELIWSTARRSIQREIGDSAAGYKVMVGMRGYASWGHVWEAGLADTARAEIHPRKEPMRMYAYFD